MLIYLPFRVLKGTFAPVHVLLQRICILYHPPNGPARLLVLEATINMIEGAKWVLIDHSLVLLLFPRITNGIRSHLKNCWDLTDESFQFNNMIERQMY